MSSKSEIEWTDATWNPVRGCTKISPGCKHCYAETFAERWRGVPGHPYEQGFDLRLVPEKLADPLRWTRSRLVFVNSMSDLFHEQIQLMFIELVADVMRLASWHGFQVLTKRADRLRVLSSEIDLIMPNAIYGVSVEDRRFGVPRIWQLKEARVAKRFLSIEPLLEDLGDLDLSGIDWVVVGGESGPGARPMHPAWLRSIRTQCEDQGVAFFFKQWGGPRKKAAGRELDGQTWDAMPELRVGPVPSAADRHRWAKHVQQRADGIAELVRLTNIRKSA